MNEPRLCPVCGGVIERRYAESYSRFMRRHTCSVKCGNVRRSQGTGTRMREYIAEHKPTCETCGKPITPRKNESVGQFMRRRYCSAGCVDRHAPQQRKQKAPVSEPVNVKLPTPWQPITMRPDFDGPPELPPRPGVNGLPAEVRSLLVGALKFHDPDFIQVWGIMEAGEVDTAFGLDSPIRAIA